MKPLTLCKKCKSFVNNKCKDYFEPGVVCACVNYLEKSDADRERTHKC